MLVRIRALAGSVVGGGFILLLALSMLQTGSETNPLAILRPSPDILTVGDQTVDWSELSPMRQATSALYPFASEAYQGQPYAALLTSLAAEDAWDGGSFMLGSAARQQLTDLLRFDSGNDAVIGEIGGRLAPISAFYHGLAGRYDDESIFLPKTLKDASRNQAVQPFDFEVLSLNISTDGIETPDDEVLQAHLDANEDRFERPAHWDIEGVIFSVSTLAEAIDIDEDQLRLYYNNNQEEFDLPVGHEVITIGFATDLEATLFTAQVDGGMDVEQAIQSSTGQRVNAGIRTENALREEELAFVESNDVGALSEPFDNQSGGSSFFYYASTRPQTVLSYSEARGQIDTNVRRAQAQATFGDLVNDQQTAYAVGASDLEALAQAAGAEIQTFEGLQRLELAPEILQSQELFTNLDFQRSPSDDLLRSVLRPNESEILARVTAYEAPRPFTLEEARDRVLADWQQEQALERINTIAEDAKARLENGESLEAVSTALTDETSVETAFSVEANLSRLRIAQEPTVLSSTFIAQWDGAAIARVATNASTFSQRSMLALNPNLISPFAMADGQVDVVNLGATIEVVRAKRLPLPEATPIEELTEEEQLAREEEEAQIETLVEYSVGIQNVQAQFNALFADFAHGREFNIDEDAILEQRAITQQRLAIQEANAANVGF